MPGQVRLAALRAFIRPTKNLCSNRCRDGMSAVPLCLNPQRREFPSKPITAAPVRAYSRHSGGFGRQLAGAFGCVPSRVLAAGGTPLCSCGPQPTLPVIAFFVRMDSDTPIGCVSIFQFIFHQAVPVVNRRTPASAPTFKEKDPARTARGGHGTINRKRRHPSGERHRRSVRDSLPGRSGTSRRQGLAARPRGRCPILDRPNV